MLLFKNLRQIICCYPCKAYKKEPRFKGYNHFQVNENDLSLCVKAEALVTFPLSSLLFSSFLRSGLHHILIEVSP